MTTRRSMDRRRPRRAIRPPGTPYVHVSQGPDGRVRTERFKNAAGYRLRLAERRAGEQGVSLDDVIDLLSR